MTDETNLGIDGISQVRPLDSGGFADVYEARDEFGRRVAIKVLKALDEAARRRFDRERSVMGIVAGHPHIVNPFTSGYTADNGRPYVVMEYLGGGSLQQRLDRQGPMPVFEAISMIEPIADALGASHRAGIIHKDVKPANILLTDDGTPKLADFGIASIRDVTTTTALAYSPAYTPPETFHADAGGDLRDERSDLYSLAATLFALVVGQGPFLTGTESAAAAMVRILNDPPPQTGYPDLDRFLAVAMAKDPGHRYQNGADFNQALRSVGSGTSRAFEPPTQIAPPDWPGGASRPIPPTPGVAPQTVSAPPPVAAGASWDGRPAAPVPAGSPPAGYSDGPAGGAAAADDVRATAGSRRPWLAAGAFIATLVIGAGLLAVVFRARSDDGTDVAGGQTTVAETGSTTEPSGGGGESTTTETSTPEVPTSILGDTGDLTGTTVNITGIESGEANLAGIEGALAVLSDQTGIDITYSTASDGDVQALVDGGNAPDITMFAQPIVLADFARNDDLFPIPSDVASDVSLVWNGAWTGLGNVDGVQYGVPNKSDPKSLVWYKPARFAELGYETPQSWSELVALTDQAIADGHTPWCVGIESSSATGWVFTDWVEDVLLRRHGTAVYDRWVAGDLRFSDPEVVETFEEVRDLWTLPGAVHAAGGSILATGFDENGAPLIDDECLMHRQAAFFGSLLPAGTSLADGTADAVDVFYLPSEDQNRPMVSAGSWAAAFADRPEVWVVLRYLGSTEYANNRQAAQAVVTGSDIPSGFLTAVNGIDRNLFSPVENSMLDILAVAGPVRYDASDAMPAAVGGDTFWSEGTAFVAGEKDAAAATAAIDASWPR